MKIGQKMEAPLLQGLKNSDQNPVFSSPSNLTAKLQLSVKSEQMQFRGQLTTFLNQKNRPIH